MLCHKNAKGAESDDTDGFASRVHANLQKVNHSHKKSRPSPGRQEKFRGYAGKRQSGIAVPFPPGKESIIPAIKIKAARVCVHGGSSFPYWFMSPFHIKDTDAAVSG
ncbi:MAG: hypothetical protein LUG50_07670, partial [Planctomycetaceae bacterium]|nr:hypothetical protein [Planctomycetaceae bacterium]